MSQSFRLTELNRSQQKAQILDIDASDSIKQRLFQFGFQPGTIVSFISQMAFNGPLSFSLDGTKVALRPQEAALISVKPL